jgi:DNA-binding NarL/FixJ family response regulator
MANTSVASFLPNAADDQPARDSGEARTEASRARITILVADDHAETRKSLCAVLAAHGYDQIVGQATTGKQAVAEARRLLPDLVLLDLSMPELDGLSAAQLIKKACPEIRILIFTVHTGNLFRNLAKNMGLDGFVTKGTSTEDLLAAIDEVCQRHKYFPA